MILLLFTWFHSLISLVAIAAGFPVVYGLIVHKEFKRWTDTFLVMTMATSVTGFFFPFHGFKPSYAVGVLSVIVLTFAMLARYRHHVAGGWRITYSITAVIAFYFNFFVLIVQSFEKIPPLKALAPTQTELPFKVAQTVALLVFFFAGLLACRKKETAPLPRR